MYRQRATSEHWILRVASLRSERLRDELLGGLVLVDPEGWLSIRTGVMYGSVDTEFQLLDSKPDSPDPHWEDVVELSAKAEDSEPVVLLGAFQSDSEVDMSLPLIRLTAKTTYRVRVHSFGRDLSSDDEGADVEADTHEQLLLQFWQEDDFDPEVLKMSSTSAETETRWFQSRTGPGAFEVGIDDSPERRLAEEELRRAGESE